MFNSEAWTRWDEIMSGYSHREEYLHRTQVASAKTAERLDGILTYLTLASDGGQLARSIFGDVWLNSSYTLYQIMKQRDARGLPPTVNAHNELPKHWDISTATGRSDWQDQYEFQRVHTITGSDMPARPLEHRFVNDHFVIRRDLRNRKRYIYAHEVTGFTHPDGYLNRADNYHLCLNGYERNVNYWRCWTDYHYAVPSNHPFRETRDYEHPSDGGISLNEPIIILTAPDTGLMPIGSLGLTGSGPNFACLFVWARMFMWYVRFWADKTPAVIFPSSPMGIRNLIQLRDIPEGRTRRQAVAHWVSGHWRENSYNREEEVKVREHIRAAGNTFMFFGLNCQVYPSEIDLERNHRLAVERANDPDTRRPKTPRERAEERHRRRRHLR